MWTFILEIKHFKTLVFLSLFPFVVKCEPVYLEAEKHANCRSGFQVCTAEICGKHKNEPQRVTKGHERCFYLPSVDKCFWLQYASVNFSTAYETCEGKSMVIPDVKTKEEDKELSETYKGLYKKIHYILGHWLAIRYDAGDYRPRHVYDGSPLGEDDWRGTEGLPVIEKDKFCVWRDMYSSCWDTDFCHNNQFTMCEGPSVTVPGKPTIKSEKLNLKKFEMIIGDNFDVDCSADLHVKGKLSLLILFPTRIVLLEDDNRVHCEEKIRSKPDTADCERPGKCFANVLADKSLEGAFIGCTSFDMKGVEPCSVEDSFCSLIGPIKVVEKGEQWNEFLLFGITAFFASLVFIPLLCYLCSRKGTAKKMTAEGESVSTSKAGSHIESLIPDTEGSSTRESRKSITQDSAISKMEKQNAR